MKDHIVFQSDSLTDAASELNRLIDVLESISGDLSRIDTSREWWSKVRVQTSRGRSSASGALRTLKNTTNSARSDVSDIVKGIAKAKSLFEDAEKRIIQRAGNMSEGEGHTLNDGSANARPSSGTMLDKIKNLIDKSFDVIRPSWDDFAKGGLTAFKIIGTAIETYGNYAKIGRAVGGKTATQWWMKNAFKEGFDLKLPKGISKAKNAQSRFIRNLTNAGSDFNPKVFVKNMAGDFVGKNGVTKAVASWADLAIDGALNWFDNKEEQAASGGTMSDGRVVAETVTETAINFAAKAGVGIALGAAIATGPVTVPAVAITVAAGFIVDGINTGVEKLTGKSATEWASDFILDTGEKAMEAIGNGVKAVGESVTGWFASLAT